MVGEEPTRSAWRLGLLHPDERPSVLAGQRPLRRTCCRECGLFGTAAQCVVAHSGSGDVFLVGSRFAVNDPGHSATLMRAMDQLNSRYGRGTLRLLVTGITWP